MRAFLALPLPKPTLAALVRMQADLPTGRPVPEENLHLTLAFLGETQEATLEALHDILSAARLPAPEIAFAGLGTFAEMERGLVFAEVTPTPVLTALQAKVAQAARSAGATLPRRRFHPHVTCMRANRQPTGPARDRLAVTLGSSPHIPGFTADALVLYASTLTRTGPRYEVLASYVLG